MQKTKRFFGLFLASALTLSIIPTQYARADSISSSLKVSVEGGGVVAFEDTSTKHELKNGDVFESNYTEGLNFKISLKADEGNTVEKVTVNGKVDTSIKPGTKSGEYNYLSSKTPSDISVTFVNECDVVISEYLAGKYNSERSLSLRKDLTSESSMSSQGTQGRIKWKIAFENG